MSKAHKFKPFPLLIGRHFQTILSAFISFYRDPESQRRFVHLRNGGRISIEITTPPHWTEKDPTVVMVHGLCGSHKSHYLVRIANKLYHKNIRSIRVNLRGCRSDQGVPKQIYNPTSSDDLWMVLKEIRRTTPHSPLTMVGFSFGGNVVLKMIGEREEEAKQLVKKAIAVNPPVDLYASVRLLSENRFYRRYFMHYVLKELNLTHKDSSLLKILPKVEFFGFDELYLAAQAGYSSAKEYYYAMSSGRLILSIAIPCHILFARDDPIVDCNAIKEVKVPQHIDVILTQKGGHLGFLGIPGREGGFFWMDSVILNWIFEGEVPPSRN